MAEFSRRSFLERVGATVAIFGFGIPTAKPTMPPPTPLVEPRQTIRTYSTPNVYVSGFEARNDAPTPAKLKMFANGQHLLTYLISPHQMVIHQFPIYEMKHRDLRYVVEAQSVADVHVNILWGYR